jgi:hypothetical protein
MKQMNCTEIEDSEERWVASDLRLSALGDVTRALMRPPDQTMIVQIEG